VIKRRIEGVRPRPWPESNGREQDKVVRIVQTLSVAWSFSFAGWRGSDQIVTVGATWWGSGVSVQWQKIAVSHMGIAKSTNGFRAVTQIGGASTSHWLTIRISPKT
jgi:hypothetical protein